MNSAFIFPNSTPISSESGDGGGNGGKIYKNILKVVSFVTQWFMKSLIMSSAFVFPNSTPIFSESWDGGGNWGENFKGTLRPVSFVTQGFSRSLITFLNFHPYSFVEWGWVW